MEDLDLDCPGEDGGEEDAGCEGDAEDIKVERCGQRLSHCRG